MSFHLLRPSFALFDYVLFFEGSFVCRGSIGENAIAFVCRALSTGSRIHVLRHPSFSPTSGGYALNAYPALDPSSGYRRQLAHRTLRVLVCLCACVRACGQVRACELTCVFVCVCIGACVHTYMSAWVHVCMDGWCGWVVVCMCVCVRVHVCGCVPSACVCVCVCAHMCVHISFR